MSQTPKHILDKIQEAKEKQSKRLSLYREQLSKIPSEVFELDNLEELDLRYNQLTFVPSEIQALKNLKLLDLRSNPLQKVVNIRGLMLDYDVYQKVKSDLSPKIFMACAFKAMYFLLIFFPSQT